MSKNKYNPNKKTSKKHISKFNFAHNKRLFKPKRK